MTFIQEIALKKYLSLSVFLFPLFLAADASIVIMEAIVECSMTPINKIEVVCEIKRINTNFNNAY